jgi:formate/nitrite transporter FocA (FNT family)
MTAPDAAPEPRTRVRRERSATESLLSIALLLEAILVLPAGLVFGGGAVLVVLLLVTGRLVGRAIGVWTGWVLQAALIALGILLPLMYFVGALFLAIWIYCVVTGRRLDRQKAAYLAEHPEHLTT